MSARLQHRIKNISSDGDRDVKGPARHRRSVKQIGGNWPPKSRENWIEVLVVVDGPMVKYHGSKVRHYVLTLMRMVRWQLQIIFHVFILLTKVDLIYRDKSVGNLIRVSLVKLILLKDHESFASSSRSGGSGSVSASELLKTFCKWQRQLTSDKTYYDVALLLTRFGSRQPSHCTSHTNTF